MSRSEQAAIIKRLADSMAHHGLCRVVDPKTGGCTCGRWETQNTARAEAMKLYRWLLRSVVLLVVMGSTGCYPNEGKPYSPDPSWVSVGGLVWTKCDAHGNRIYTYERGIAVVKGC